MLAQRREGGPRRCGPARAAEAEEQRTGGAAGGAAGRGCDETQRTRHRGGEAAGDGGVRGGGGGAVGGAGGHCSERGALQPREAEQ